MALAAATVWEIRQQATPANVNSGGFNPSNTGNGGGPGTDFSQQLTAQYTFTDLASTSASSWLVITSASHSFVGADCGNLIHINTTGTGAHFTTGFYEIVSVSAGAATLDRACGSGADASGGTYHVGGALSLQDTTDQATCNAMVPGNKVWPLGGAAHPTYTLTGTLNINTAAGTTLSQISWEGYAVTRGDKPTGSTRPAINGAAFLCGNNFNFTSMIFSSSAAGNQVTLGSRCWMYLCKISNTSTTANLVAVTPGNYDTFLNCEIVCMRGRGLSYGNEINVVNCYFHDSDIGILNSNGSNNYGSTYISNIFDSMVTAALDYTGADDTSDIVEGNTFFGGITNKTGIGVAMVTNNANKRFWNNIFYGFVTGISCADSSQALQGTSMLSNWNDYFNNTTDVSNITKGVQDIAINPNFANVGQLTGAAGVVSGSSLTVASSSGIVANQDFVYIISGTGATAGQYLITAVVGNVLTLNAAPGGSGTNIAYQITTGRNFLAQGLGNKGSLGVFPGGLTTGYQNIGAAQSVPTLASTFVG